MPVWVDAIARVIWIALAVFYWLVFVAAWWLGDTDLAADYVQSMLIFMILAQIQGRL